MLFNSFTFMFIFLPITLIGFLLLGRGGLYKTSLAWLVLTSLFFYGWWNPKYLILIIVSILINFTLGLQLFKTPTKKLLALGVAFNLGLIGYFKYANFFVDSINAFGAHTYHLNTIILPLAISFFTFQQIAYLVSVYKGETEEHHLLQYSLFVTFFPQLIAGPIVHHTEMLPQFAKGLLGRINTQNIVVGFSIFLIGLFKKIVLADQMALYATPVFDAAYQGTELTFFEAWGGALAYTFQLYFDFSGYSDMAIGLARLFGIILPLNFHSPYKATSIIDFWRRWHITLSRFLKTHLYIPLGGNRKGKSRRYANLMITMLLGGLWHGAGCTFIIWGGLHGLYLCINHAWHKVCRATGNNIFELGIGRIVSLLLTFTAIVIGWVFFRAQDTHTAVSILNSMAGMNGISLPAFLSAYMPTVAPLSFGGPFTNNLADWAVGIPLFVLAFFIIWAFPNTQQIFEGYKPALNMQDGHSLIKYKWRPSSLWAAIMAILTVVTFIFMLLSQSSEFLYFDF